MNVDSGQSESLTPLARRTSVRGDWLVDPLIVITGAVTNTSPADTENAVEVQADSPHVVDVDELSRRRFWRECLEELKAEISFPSWATWLANSVLVEASGNRYVIGVAQQMGRDWVEQRYTQIIRDVIARRDRRRGRVVVEFVVIDGLAQPTFDEPPTVVEVEVVRPPREGEGHDRARIENNIGRKAIFALQGKRGPNVGTVTVRDVVGKVTRTFTLGQLGGLEMDVYAWLLGQWTPRNGGRITFGLRELARGLRVSWNGDFGIEAKHAIRRMKAMTITGKVWDADTRRYKEHGFSLVDDYQLEEDRDSPDAEGTRGSGRVRVLLGDWIVRQMQAGQYAELDLDIYRSHALRKPKARRLFQFLECEEGENDGTFVRLPIDEYLAETMGTSDYRNNPSRFRRDLLAYGTAICTATSGLYESFDIKAGSGRNAWVLHVRRADGWRRRREEGRRLFNAEYRQDLLGLTSRDEQRSSRRALA